MDEIKIRYGESVTLDFDANDTHAVSATLYIGKAGEVPVKSFPIGLTDGVGVFELSDTDTEIPLGTYKYQITVIDDEGHVDKYPDPEDCNDCDNSEDNLPQFIVYEALDAMEVVS